MNQDGHIVKLLMLVERREIAYVMLEFCFFFTLESIQKFNPNFYDHSFQVKFEQTWKAQCPIFKAIVAGFRGKVA